MKKKPDWLPNWKNVAEYPDLATTTAQQWAWEFLRRNDNYQADYEELVKFQENGDPGINKFANEVINSCYEERIEFTAETSPLPVAFLTNHLLPGLYGTKDSYPWIPEVCWRLVKDYNLQSPLSPTKSYRTPPFIECDNLPVIETTHLRINTRKIPDDRKLTISVDMDGNLEDQLNYIKGFFSSYGKQPKIRKSEYLDCLRFLDGVESHAPWNVIAKELKKTREAYDQIAKKAKELRSTGFFALSKSKLIPGKGKRREQGQTNGKVFFETNSLAPSLRQSIPWANCTTSNNTEIHIKPHLSASKTA